MGSLNTQSKNINKHYGSPSGHLPFGPFRCSRKYQNPPYKSSFKFRGGQNTNKPFEYKYLYNHLKTLTNFNISPKSGRFEPKIPPQLNGKFFIFLMTARQKFGPTIPGPASLRRSELQPEVFRRNREVFLPPPIPQHYCSVYCGDFSARRRP